MKKVLLVFLLALMLVGCDKDTDSNENSEESAKTLHETVLKLEHTTLPQSSQNFDIDWTVELNNSGSYRYTVTIYNPKMAMCSIKAMAIIDGAYGDVSTTSQMPQIGIDGKEINLYPNQVNESNNCYEKIELVINSKISDIWISVVVDWKNKEGTKSFREYLSNRVTYVKGE